MDKGVNWQIDNFIEEHFNWIVSETMVVIVNIARMWVSRWYVLNTFLLISARELLKLQLYFLRTAFQNVWAMKKLKEEGFAVLSI